MDFWHWFTLITGIIGVVAFLMAMIPFIQRPKIVIGFDVIAIGDIEYLECLLWNEPMLNRFIQWLGIERNTVPDVEAYFVILHSGSKREIFKPEHLVKIKTKPGVIEQRASLPPSLIPSSFAICITSKTEGICYTLPDDTETRQVIPVGTYIAKVELEHSGKMTRAQKAFTVQANYPFAFWQVEPE